MSHIQNLEEAWKNYIASGEPPWNHPTCTKDSYDCPDLTCEFTETINPWGWRLPCWPNTNHNERRYSTMKRSQHVIAIKNAAATHAHNEGNWFAAKPETGNDSATADSQGIDTCIWLKHETYDEPHPKSEGSMKELYRIRWTPLQSPNVRTGFLRLSRPHLPCWQNTNLNERRYSIMKHAHNERKWFAAKPDNDIHNRRQPRHWYVYFRPRFIPKTRIFIETEKSVFEYENSKFEISHAFDMRTRLTMKTTYKI